LKRLAALRTHLAGRNEALADRASRWRSTASIVVVTVAALLAIAPTSP
jgi:hypothetical protein